METPSRKEEPTGSETQEKRPASSIEKSLPRNAVIYSSVVAFLAWVVCVYDYIMFGTLLPVIAGDLGWSTATSTAIATYAAVGTFFVALMVGPLIDYLGRKNALIFTTGGTALSSALTALTPAAFAAPFLTVVRSVAGLGYAEQAVNATYLNEIYGNRRGRGFMYSLVQGGWPVGVLLAAAFTALLLEPVGWRGVFLLATIPALIVALLGFKLRESPRFLALREIRKLEKEGREEEALELGQRFDIDVQHVEQATIKQLFEPGIRRHTIFLALAFLANWVGIQTFAVLGTTVLTEGKGVSFGSALTVLIVSNAAAFFGYLAHGFLGDKIGRRPTIAAGWIVSGAAFTVMLFGPDSSAYVLTMYTVGLFFLIGPYSALLYFTGESFPTRMRGTGASFVNAMGPIGGIVGAALLTAILSTGADMTIAALLSGGVAILLSGVLMLGTRNVTDPQQAESLPGRAE